MIAVTRRAALATGAALLAAPAAGAADPDAELIAAVRAYQRAVETYNEHGGVLEYEVCPLWATVEAARDRAEAAPPARTWAGIGAVAELCRSLAHEEAPGMFDYSDSFTGHWAGEVIDAVLRLTRTDASEAGEVRKFAHLLTEPRG